MGAAIITSTGLREKPIPIAMRLAAGPIHKVPDGHLSLPSMTNNAIGDTWPTAVMIV